METHDVDYPLLNFSRTQSNHNLSCYIQSSCDKKQSHFKGTSTPSKKQKLDAILTTLKSFKNSQSTNDLHSAARLSAKYITINNQSSPKEDQSFIVDKRVPAALNQSKQLSQRKYQLNITTKNFTQRQKKEENSFCHELKNVLSTDALKKVKFHDSQNKQLLNKNLSRNDISCQNNSKLVSSLQNQKNSLQAIKQKLQKYGINLTKHNQQTSRIKFNQNKYDQHNKSRAILKSYSNINLKSSEELSFLQKDKIKQNQGQTLNLIYKQDPRPLTSLKQKDVSFYQPFSTPPIQMIKHSSNSIRNSINDDFDQKRNSPLKSITSTNSMTSAKAHAKIFNLNMQNFTGELYHFGQNSISKKPGSYGNNQKSKLNDSDQYGTALKQKPGSYGNKKSLKSIFDPSSSFSKNSNISSYQITDSNLKQTIQTDCTSPKLQKKLTIKDFTLGRQIGKGKFGRVFLCTHNQTGFLSALKIIKKDMIRKQRNIEQLIRQIKIQMFLNHSNNVKMYGYFDDSQNIYLLIQYCNQGQLYTLLKAKKKFQQDQAIPIIKDICQGLNHLHSKNIIHRDIKPENIVLSFQLSKLCDFGWSVNSQNQKRQTFCGTPLYVSPELLMGKTYDYKVDIWALGIMVYELLTGKLPFHITNEKQLRKIVTNEVKYPQHLSQNAKNFIQHLLQKNPSYRNDMQTILKHKFLVEGLERIKNKPKVNN